MIRDRQDRREIPAGTGYEYGRPGASLVDNRPLYGPHNVPDNEYEALMVCDFGQEPQPHLAERVTTEQFDTLFDMAELTAKERSVIELVVFGQMSLAEAGIWLGREYNRAKPYHKTLVHKVRNTALDKLRKVADVSSYLGRGSTESDDLVDGGLSDQDGWEDVA